MKLPIKREMEVVFQAELGAGIRTRDLPPAYQTRVFRTPGYESLRQARPAAVTDDGDILRLMAELTESAIRQLLAEHWPDVPAGGTRSSGLDRLTCFRPVEFNDAVVAHYRVEDVTDTRPRWFAGLNVIDAAGEIAMFAYNEVRALAAD